MAIWPICVMAIPPEAGPVVMALSSCLNLLSTIRGLGHSINSLSANNPGLVRRLKGASSLLPLAVAAYNQVSSAAYALALVAGRADFLCSGIGVCAPGPGPQSRVVGADHHTCSLAGADLPFCIPGRADPGTGTPHALNAQPR